MAFLPVTPSTPARIPRVAGLIALRGEAAFLVAIGPGESDVSTHGGYAPLNYDRSMSLKSNIVQRVYRSAPFSVAMKAFGRMHGVTIAREGDVVHLSSGNKLAKVSVRQSRFLPELVGNLDAYFEAFPYAESGGLKVLDLSLNPAPLFNYRICRSNHVNIRFHSDLVWLEKDGVAAVLSPSHAVYAGDIAMHFDSYVLPLKPGLREGKQVVDFTRPGILQTYKASGLQFEMAFIPEEIEAIEDYQKWYKPQPGDLVFDIGAHCGVSSYYLSQMVGPAGRVICFEPDPTNFELLRRNIERHRLTNVTAVQMALAGSSGTLAFNSEGTIGSGLATLLDRNSVGKIVEVQAITLEEAFRRWGVPKLCKIDIEKAEIEVLRSSAEILKYQKPHFVIDTNHLIDGILTTRAVEAMLREYGYEVESGGTFATTWARPA